ncbi:hypothetical protein D7B24_003690 [Verticillium nonalfalfae]|uniref:Uncharacterized protein n=1 Tax=Verticillium nonalfalfae TaxID=1051616 RepID=A0A3M9XW05_9PEZI|nr:uncharacterized protein D7B24_003690 [Verticillium nonalfalfae]RNJ52429.1 hypothetical protein D7B24_003690 [Verticillium nonalfalfae]
MLSRAAKARGLCLPCQLRRLAGSQPRAPLRLHAHPLCNASARQLRLYSAENPWARLESAKDVLEKKTRPSRPPSQDDTLPWTVEANSKAAQDGLANTTTVTQPPSKDDSLEWLDQLEPSGPDEYLGPESLELESLEPDTDRRRRGPKRRTARGASANYTPRDVNVDAATDGQPQQHGDTKERVHHGRIGHRRVTLQPEALDVEILGQRAHTIVMRDNLRPRPRRAIEEAAEEATMTEEASDAAMRARVDALQDRASPDEALANLEELRPQTRLLSGNEFWALHDVLSEGFTSAQLAHYVRANKRMPPPPPLARGSASAAADVRAPRPWMARPYALRPVEDLQLPAGASVKSRAVFTLMRTTWMLDIWERVEALNEVDILFKDASVAAALHTGHEGLDRIGRLRRDLLQAGESLTFGDSSARLRIVARRAAAEAIIDSIEGLVTAIATESFVLCPARSAKTDAGAAFRDTLLNELGRLTKTTLVLDDSGLVHVKWIKSQNDLALGGHHLEHMGHILWRLLYTAHAQTPPTALLAQDFIAAGGVLNPVANAEDRWAWKDRLGDWSRWILPVTRDADALVSTQALVDRLPTMLERAAPEPETSSDTDTLWSTAEQNVSTTFGHVLFDHDNGTLDVKNLQTQDGGVAVLAPAKEGVSRPRVFSAVVPSPAGLAALNNLAPATPASTTMILRFATSPASTGARYLLDPADGAKQIHATTAPASYLEIHVAVPDDLPADGRLTWDASPAKHVRALSHESLIDVPLPDRPVDLRLATTSVSSLHDPDAVPALRAFVDASHLDLVSGHLRTPPRLFIPEDQLAPLAQSSAGGRDAPSSRAGRKPNKAAEDVFAHRSGCRTFEFIGLEVRRAVALDYEGHKLRYTSVEAGLHGGRRAELALDMGLRGAGGDEAAHRARYVALARRLADGELVTWVQGGRAVGETERGLGDAPVLARPAEQDMEEPTPGERVSEHEAEELTLGERPADQEAEEPLGELQQEGERRVAHEMEHAGEDVPR